MPEPKTKTTNASVADFLGAIPHAQIRRDCLAIAALMRAATKAKPRMWGANIVGFGEYRSVYANGRETHWPVIAFAPRRQHFTLYIADDFKQRDELLAKLGKHKHGKCCLHIKRLADVDLPMLKKLVGASVKHVTSASPGVPSRTASKQKRGLLQK